MRRIALDDNPGICSSSFEDNAIDSRNCSEYLPQFLNATSTSIAALMNHFAAIYVEHVPGSSLAHLRPHLSMQQATPGRPAKTCQDRPRLLIIQNYASKPYTRLP